MSDETQETLPDPKPTRHPKELSSEYHKAHKQLMLWSAILFIWELVGVDLGKAKDAGGNIGAVVTALKSPQAVPWALLILVGYFLFKCSVEWAQCDIARRRIAFARVDYVSALFVSGTAIMLYVVQTISKAQFADRFSQFIDQRLKTTIILILTGFPIRRLVIVPQTMIRRDSTLQNLLFGTAAVAPFFIGLLMGAMNRLTWTMTLIIVCINLSLVGVALLIGQRLSAKITSVPKK